MSIFHMHVACWTAAVNRSSWNGRVQAGDLVEMGEERSSRVRCSLEWGSAGEDGEADCLYKDEKDLRKYPATLLQVRINTAETASELFICGVLICQKFKYLQVCRMWKYSYNLWSQGRTLECDPSTKLIKYWLPYFSLFKHIYKAPVLRKEHSLKARYFVKMCCVNMPFPFYLKKTVKVMLFMDNKYTTSNRFVFKLKYI